MNTTRGAVKLEYLVILGVFVLAGLMGWLALADETKQKQAGIVVAFSGADHVGGQHAIGFADQTSRPGNSSARSGGTMSFDHHEGEDSTPTHTALAPQGLDAGQATNNASSADPQPMGHDPEHPGLAGSGMSKSPAHSASAAMGGAGTASQGGGWSFKFGFLTILLVVLLMVGAGVVAMANPSR